MYEAVQFRRVQFPQWGDAEKQYYFMPISPKYIAITQVGCNYPFEKFSGEIEWSNFLEKL